MGVVINQRVPIYSNTNKYNEKYISTKVKKLESLNIISAFMTDIQSLIKTSRWLL